MISHRVAKRPPDWAEAARGLKHRWMVPFRAFEWLCEWIAYGLGNWSFLESLEYLGSLSVLIGVIFYFSESGDRVKQRHYQAWQVINTAQGKGGNGGRIEALQELNEDKVQLVGVDVSSAFLQGIRLQHAKLMRADFSAADMRGCDLRFAELVYADLQSANLRGSRLEDADLSNANLKDMDLVGASLARAKLDGVDLSSTDLRSADLKDIQWQRIKSVRDANISGIKEAPEGFVRWAIENGAIESAASDE